MIETALISVAGVESPVRFCGPVDHKEAVVFVHGNPGASEDWIEFLPQVGAFARAIAPDMPGYGKAARPRDFDYTVEGYARYLNGILDALGIQRVHLVLHDFGGPWGTQWASQHPQRVASISLINIGIMPGYRWHKYARIWRMPLLGELFQLSTTRMALRKVMNADNPKPFPDSFINRIFENADWGHKRAVLKLYRATSDLDGFSARIGAVLKPLELPALVIWGDGDIFLPVRYAELQKDYFQAEVHVLPGCGHWPMIDEPEKVSSLLIPFLRRQVGAAGG